MDTLLDALQEGRLFELPENDKDHALQFLAHIIEAFPEMPAGTDIVDHVLQREQTTTTALGKGWACPHARIGTDEDLMSVVGWSPQGIDYGAPDGRPVSIIVMYLVPANQRNHFLREVSILAKALETYADLEKFREAKDLNDIRNYLLDLIGSTKESVGPDARARMIRLQAKPTVSTATFAAQDLSHLIMEPVTLVAAAGVKPIVLTQNAELAGHLQAVTGMVEKIEAEGVFQSGEWRILRRHAVSYQGGAIAYDCLAVKAAFPPLAAAGATTTASAF
jgi:PTS system nitrogen regulatory IIA component